jgi:TetR/AcrR family transcriptional regulator of autoinduction and epiphytic fitness
MADIQELDDDLTVDGRVLRGRRNREAIVDAMVAMYEQGNLRPTASQVADAAGLSTRSVYHHFDDMKSLVHEVSSRSEERMHSIDYELMQKLPVDERVSSFVEHRFERWESTNAVVRAGLLAEFDSKVVAELMNLGRDERLRETADVFSNLVGRGAGADVTFAGLDVVFGYETWHKLIEVRKLSPKKAMRLVATLAHSLL